MTPSQTYSPIPVWRQEASENWCDGALLGNGDVGVVCYTEATEAPRLVFAIGKNDVWERRWFRKDERTCSHKRFLELLAQHGEDWERFVDPPPPPRPPKPPCSSGPKPVCRIELHPVAGRVEHQLSLEEAELVTTSSVGLRVVSRVQRDANVVCLHISSETPLRITLTRRPSPPEIGIAPHACRMDDHDGVALLIQDFPPESTYPGGFRVATAMAVSSRDEARREGDDRSVTFEVPREAHLFAAVVTTRDDPDPVAAAVRAAREASRQGDEALRARHVRGWSKFWEASRVCIDDPLVNDLWHVHNYLLASAARPGAIAPGLFGPWIVNDRVAWSGAYFNDYNFQLTFAAALSCNHPELLEPYFAALEAMLPVAAQCARDNFEVEGVAFPHEILPIDMTGQWNEGSYLCETPWLVQHFWEYYLHTLDERFLRERAWPMLAGAADLIANYATEVSPGRYSLFPSKSCEHHVFSRSHTFARDVMADLAMGGYVLRAALEAAALLQKTGETRTQRWRAVLDGFPNFPTAQTQCGDVFVDCRIDPPSEGVRPPVTLPALTGPFTSAHRPSKRPGNDGPWMYYNLPHPLFPIWPGGQINSDSPPEVLLTAIRTWMTLKCEGSNDLIFRHVAAARLGIPTLEQLKADVTPRLMMGGAIACQMNRIFDDDPDGRAQLVYRNLGIYTENFAFPLAVTEMMLQSDGGVIKLFPAWDPDRRATFHRLRARGGFLVSAECDRGFVKWATIEPTVSAPCRLRLPWPAEHFRLSCAAAPMRYAIERRDAIFQAEAGRSYRLEPMGTTSVEDLHEQ